MIVVFNYSIGLNGCDQWEEIEFDDDATDDHIEEEFETWCSNFIDSGWWKKDK